MSLINLVDTSLLNMIEFLDQCQHCTEFYDIDTMLLYPNKGCLDCFKETLLDLGCKNKKQLCKKIECRICFERSFASHFSSKWLYRNNSYSWLLK